MKNKAITIITSFICAAHHPSSVYAASPVPLGIVNPALTKFVGENALAMLIATLWKTAFLITGIITLAYIVLGGISWATASGDKANSEKARSMITDAVIGLVIVAASYAIIKFLGGVLGIDILNPQLPI